VAKDNERRRPPGPRLSFAKQVENIGGAKTPLNDPVVLKLVADMLADEHTVKCIDVTKPTDQEDALLPDLDLDPGARRALPVRRPRVLRHQSFVSSFLDDAPRLTAVARQSPAGEHQVNVLDDFLEDLPALDKRRLRRSCVPAWSTSNAMKTGGVEITPLVSSPRRWNRLRSFASKTATSPSKTTTSVFSFAIARRLSPEWLAFDEIEMPYRTEMSHMQGQ
jgi:hypothetical protein